MSYGSPLKVVLRFLFVLVLLASREEAQAASQRYVLNSGSTIAAVCRSCGTQARREPLTGSFELTMLPVASMFNVAALTSVNLSSDSFTVTGNGFLQRLGADRQALVLDAQVNGEAVLLTSGRRQHAEPRGLTIVLSSPRGVEQTYVLLISASPEDSQLPDADRDGVVDSEDNCPQIANPAQEDEDSDRAGDACDQCPGTDTLSPVTGGGCSVEQLCPCDAPAPGERWGTQGDYLRCVARATRSLRRQGQLTRSESMDVMRRAVHSGCGRMVVAMR